MAEWPRGMFAWPLFRREATVSEPSLFPSLSASLRSWWHAPVTDALSRLEQSVSVLSDKIAELNQHADDAVARVTTDLTALRSQIADLQAQVASGGATQADLDALAALEAKLDALDPTPPPPPPAPTS